MVNYWTVTFYGDFSIEDTSKYLLKDYDNEERGQSQEK